MREMIKKITKTLAITVVAIALLVGTFFPGEAQALQIAQSQVVEEIQNLPPRTPCERRTWSEPRADRCIWNTPGKSTYAEVAMELIEGYRCKIVRRNDDWQPKEYIMTEPYDKVIYTSKTKKNRLSLQLQSPHCSVRLTPLEFR